MELIKKSSTLLKKQKYTKQHVPRKLKNEKLLELAIERQHGTAIEDLMFALDMKKVLSFSTFCKLIVSNDIFSVPEYKIMMPEPFVVTMYRPNKKGESDNPLYVYSSYNFTDELTKFEIFEQKLHFLRLVPMRKRIQFTIDLIACAMCSKYEFDRRSHILQYRLRQKVQFDNYSRPMLHSARHLFAKEEKSAVPIFGHILARERTNILQLTRSTLLSLEYSLKDTFHSVKININQFIEKNLKWVETRRKYKENPVYLYVNSRCFVDFINDHEKSPLKFRNVQDLFNEFNFFPSYFAHSVHICRVLKDCELKTMEDDLVFRKAITNKPLRIRPSRYQCSPATTNLLCSKFEEYSVCLPTIPKRAPSLDSLSGFSSDSAASTATQTPLDWALNWKMQDKEYEHRYTKMGVLNMENIKTDAETYFEMRMTKEKLRRKELMKKANNSFIFQENIPIFCEKTNIRQTRFDVYKGNVEMKKIKKLFETRMKESVGMDLPLKIVLSRRFDYIQKSLPHDNVSEEGISITTGWQHLSENDEDCSIFQHIGRFLRRRSSWVESNCWSLSNTIPRCDRITIKVERKNKKLVLVFILVATCLLTFVTVVVISFQ